jgi:hypothetical protein
MKAIQWFARAVILVLSLWVSFAGAVTVTAVDQYDVQAIEKITVGDVNVVVTFTDQTIDALIVGGRVVLNTLNQPVLIGGLRVAVNQQTHKVSFAKALTIKQLRLVGVRTTVPTVSEVAQNLAISGTLEKAEGITTVVVDLQKVLNADQLPVAVAWNWQATPMVKVVAGNPTMKTNGTAANGHQPIAVLIGADRIAQGCNWLNLNEVATIGTYRFANNLYQLLSQVIPSQNNGKIVAQGAGLWVPTSGTTYVRVKRTNGTYCTLAASQFAKTGLTSVGLYGVKVGTGTTPGTGGFSATASNGSISIQHMDGAKQDIVFANLPRTAGTTYVLLLASNTSISIPVRVTGLGTNDVGLAANNAALTCDEYYLVANGGTAWQNQVSAPVQLSSTVSVVPGTSVGASSQLLSLLCGG